MSREQGSLSLRGSRDVQTQILSVFDLHTTQPGSCSNAQEAYHDAVVPGKNGQFVQPSNKIPPRGDVSSDEDAEREDGEWVHESRTAGAHALRHLFSEARYQ